MLGVTIPGDVPCTTPDELTALAAALPSGPGAAFVPSLSGFCFNHYFFCAIVQNADSDVVVIQRLLDFLRYFREHLLFVHCGDGMLGDFV